MIMTFSFEHFILHKPPKICQSLWRQEMMKDDQLWVAGATVLTGYRGPL